MHSYGYRRSRLMFCGLLACAALSYITALSYIAYRPLAIHFTPFPLFELLLAGLFVLAFVVLLSSKHAARAALALRSALGYGGFRRAPVAALCAALALTCGVPAGSVLLRDLGGGDLLGFFTYAQAAQAGGSVNGYTTTTTAVDPRNANAPVVPPGLQPSRTLSYTDNVLDEPYAKSSPLVVGAAALPVPADRMMSACTSAGLAVVQLPDGSTPTVAVGTTTVTNNLRAVAVVSTTGTGCVFTALRR